MVIEPTPADNFMLGSNRALKGYNIASEIDVMKAEAMRGIRFFPIIKEINCIRTYAGMRPFVIDHLPIVSEVEEVPGFYIAAGHEGDGISLSAITGKMMAQIIAGEPTDFNIDQLKFSRFNNPTSDIRLGKWYTNWVKFIAIPILIIIMINSLFPFLG